MVVMIKKIENNHKTIRYQNVPTLIAKILEGKGMLLKNDSEAYKWVKS